jgi:hypothetical protein
VRQGVRVDGTRHVRAVLENYGFPETALRRNQSTAMVYFAALPVRGRLGRPICWPLSSTAHLCSQKIGVASRSATKAIDSASP